MAELAKEITTGVLRVPGFVEMCSGAVVKERGSEEDRGSPAVRDRGGAGAYRGWSSAKFR
jgi:hypothetical protein